MFIENRILHPVRTRPTVDEAMAELHQLLATPSKTFYDFIQSFALDGGKSLLDPTISALPVFRTTNTSGFNYSFEAKMRAYLRFGVTTSGYFVVQSLILEQDSAWISHYYNAEGKYVFSEGPISHVFATHTEIVMEPNCPILNHLYNILSFDYLNIHQGANTKRAHTIELLLRRLEKTRKNELSISKGANDPAIAELNQKMMEIEPDPLYTWKERFYIYNGIKAERAAMIQTKRRAHKKSFISYLVPIFLYDCVAAAQRFFIRPMNNLGGMLDRMFIDPLRWFLRMVKTNLGMSIAMAVYGPFTFFFISQPMNPHATWAVGKVRTAYIETTDKISKLFSHEDSAGITTSAALATVGTGVKTSLTSNNPFFLLPVSTKKKEDFGILLSTDIPAVNTQTWDERMSNFKAMQISYESNLEAAARMGRLEQMETQLNWPLIIESAWTETEKYLDFLKFLEANANDYQPAFIDLVKAEKNRAVQTELYLWDRNVRFILDHPYTMMNQSNEQTQMDYYVGRSFLMLRDMTTTLIQRHAGLQQPAGFEQIMNLAQKFDENYKRDGGILERLKKNSKIFSQQDPFNTPELRSYMQRQWEVLYLLQNRAQEGANLALQMYIWSVRNAVWVLQSTYATKHEDMSLIALSMKKGAPVNKLSNNATYKHTDSQYEALFHMMVLEYTSIRKEIGELLKNDIEATQRKTLIDGLESFFKEREALLKGANLI